MRVLVCGSRDWSDHEIVGAVLDGYHAAYAVTIIEGGARGADAIAVEWAKFTGVEYEQYLADWATHGKAAGPIRNQQMLDEGKPDVVIAFKDGFQRDIDPPAGREIPHIFAKGGTEDMVRRAKTAGIPVYIVSHG